MDKGASKVHNYSMVRVICLFLVLSASGAEEVSWWQKPAYQKKIRENREVIVSIKEKKRLEKSYFEMTGAGVLRATRTFTLAKILKFEELQKISPYFKKVVHEPQYKRAYFLLEAYGYEARLLIKYSVQELPEKTVFHWNVVWGGFQGMIGDVELSTLKAGKTEAVLKSEFDDKDIPLPSIFKGFVLEVIVQHVAKGMRSYIEEAYAKQLPQKG